MKQLLFILLLISNLATFSQLRPPINGTSNPKDETPICNIPLYTGSFDVSGFANGNYVNDFTLFDKDGNAFNLKEELKKGKPILIMGGNLTCPVFRDKINEFNALCVKYKNLITPIIVYGIEAHPNIDTSIYFGKVNTGSRNFADNILFRQPTTYKERKDLVDTLLTKFTFDCPIYIDQPCNEWWSKFGPAPNNAYLIDTTGKVFSKHGWFNRYPNNMSCEIDSILGQPSSCSGSGISNGTFQLKSFNGEDTARDIAGATLYAKCTIKNSSTKDVIVKITRKQVIAPQDWQTSMCIIQCLAPEDDSTTIVLTPNQTEIFSLDFFTSDLSGNGSALVEFKNMGNTANSFKKWFFAQTSGTASLQNDYSFISKVFPNPCNGNLVVESKNDIPQNYKMMNMEGITILEGKMLNKSESIDVKSIKNGLYLLELENNQKRQFYKIQIQN